MSTDLPKGHDSSGATDSNSDSENSTSSDTSGSDWECSSVKQSSLRKPHFSVTSCDTGLKLKIAAVPPRKVSPKKVAKPTVKKKNDSTPDPLKERTVVKKKKNELSETSSSSESCSRCSSDSSSEDDLPLKTVSKSLPLKVSPQKAQVKTTKNPTIKSESEEEKKVTDDIKDNVLKVCKEKSVLKTNNIVKKTKSDENNDTGAKRGRGRPRSKFASPVPESAACGSSSSSSTSSSSSSSSLSSSSSSSDSDTAEAAGGPAHNSADDSSAALAAACQLQVIDDADLAELFPEQTSSAPAQQPNFATFHNPPPDNDDKSIADNGDGSSSEMELTPQLVTAAIQRATADSSGSENECSNSESGQQNATHYASSLLQQFVAQTQLLSSTTPLTPINSSATPSLNCGLNSNPVDGVSGISDCVLGQINNLPIASNFLNTNQHLSPQQTEALSQINKDLEEITSVTESVDIAISNPPSLEDCVDNNDFMSLDIAHGGSDLGSAGDLMKSSPLTVVSVDINPLSQIDTQKLDTISTNSIESQEDVKNIIIESRRKRGRPRKVRKLNEYVNKGAESQKEDKCAVNVINFHNNNDPPNVSPDSGILSNHNSPTHSPVRRQEMDEIHSRQGRKSVQKENNTRERRAMRSKSKSRNRIQTRSDSSDSEYHKKIVENEIKEIKTEAPSPIPLKQEHNRLEKNKRIDHKLDIAALDRMLYATDRVLYPPRKKVGRKPQSKTKAASKNSPKTLKDKNLYDTGDSDDESLPSNRSVLSGVYAKRKELNSKLASMPKKSNKSFGNAWRDNQSENEAAADDPLDPTWKQIDLNPKYKDILSGYKSDHEFKPYKSCSRLIESGYKSDYGCRSGYKSDYYRSGYKSDHKSGYKSDKSGYKTDYSVRSMRRRMKKLKKTRSVRDRSYYKNQKHFVSDQEILLLTNKTFSSLTIGNSSSESECESYLRKPSSSPKYVSVCTKYPMPSKYDYGFSRMNKKHVLRPNASDPFAPGPVFSGLQRPVMTYNIFKVSHNNNNTLLKSPSKINYTGGSLPALKPVFNHKFGASPIRTLNLLPASKRENDNNLKYFTRTLSPKNRKQSKNGSVFTNMTSKDIPQKPLQNIFEKSRNTYVPNKSLMRNVFLNFKKSHIRPSFNTKRQRRTVVLAPPKINFKPAERPSRITIKTENKHHRHRSKRRHRSRSVSKCREYTKPVDSVDQKFCQDMDNLISNFIKLCQIAPKLVTQANVIQNQSKSCEKPTLECAPSKVVKRGAKKRKTVDSQEIMTPTSKRRHKKQLTESQNKGGKETNEHKLPLKKRHYHINSSTNNSLSLSLVTTEFDENSKNCISPDKFLCTETDCLGEEISREPPKIKSLQEKTKKNDAKICSQTNIQQPNCQSTETDAKISKLDTNTNGSILGNKVDELNSSHKSFPSNSINATDDDILIKKPSSEQSELSKKIYETSEKLKAVHKMVHDLEKSLPKPKESEVKLEATKQDAHKIASPRSETKSSPTRHSAPIVTPKKRHRLEAEKGSCHSSLDQVVQSLSKKLSEDKSLNANNSKEKKDVNQNNSKEDVKSSEELEPMQTINTAPVNTNTIEQLKSMSARSLYKSTIPPAQKSEIMTRKKNRLEGLTSNLVSKINPSAATKVLDTLLNNNIRKSIESRILEKEKNNTDSTNKCLDTKNKDTPQINTRATVIKSPVSKGKVIEVKKSKVVESSTEQTLVVNVDKPTGIFEPSVDLEDQIPKSSICVNNVLTDTNKSKMKLKNETKTANSLLSPIDTESDIPLALITETSDSIIRPKRGESIASVLSDKIQETTSGHNLRQPKRNISNENDDNTDTKKKKKVNNILRESKLVLPTKLLVPKIQAERLAISDTSKIITALSNQNEANEVSGGKSIETSKKKPRRRKAINRTGFPNIKRKKKKIDPNSNQNITSDSHFTSEDTDYNSAFERVPKDGEAMSSFLERTKSKKTELKVILNKDVCPKQGRLTVVALEKLQGKEIPVDNNNKKFNIIEISNTEKKNTNTCILRAPALQLKQNKTDKDLKIHVNKWEVLSETESIRSLNSAVSNDPEDSIPLSLLNLKTGRPMSRLDSFERIKRKTRAMSPCHEVEELLSKRKVVEKNSKIALRPKSSLAVLCPSEKRLTRSSDNAVEESKTKNKKLENKKVEKVPVEEEKPVSIVTRRKSRSCQMIKKNFEVHSSSRESSLDTIASQKLSCKSREPSIDDSLRDHDENDPLPLNEKEIDFEKSIDVLSKNIICKKRVASSRDDSPASSVENRDKPVVSKRNPRLRKKFLAAGLFSEYYKGDPKPEGKTKNLVSHTEFSPGLLSAPTYCERWVRRRLQHFTLPYDIWWQQHYNQPVPSWNYKKIRTNVYYDVKPSAEECESVACNCAQVSGCNEDCINRLVYSECSPQLCPCGDKCKNQRIQRHEWASGLEKFMTENKGWGVRTKHKITSGDFILEYVGEVVSDKEFKERMATRYARDTHHYCLHLDGGLVIDGHRMGGDGRFVNHSCRPNCEMQKWTANGTFRMALFALRDIDPGEELTYDYNFSLFNPAVGQPCKCDSEDCRGVIGGKSQRITKLPVKTQSRTPSNTSTQSQGSNGNQPRVGRPRKAVKCNKKSEQQAVSTCDIKNMTILKYQQHLNKLWQEPQMKPLTAKEKNLVKERHCFLFRNLETVRRIRDRLALALPASPPSPAPAPVPGPVPEPELGAPPPGAMNVNPLTLPDTMNPDIFISRLRMLRATRDENVKRLVRLDDDATLPRKERLSNVYKALYATIVAAKDDKGKPLCTPLLKTKVELIRTQDTAVSVDLSSIDTNINRGEYGNVAQFDADVSGLFSAVMREHGRASTLGTVAAQLKKVYNSAKSDFAEHLNKILGPDESLPAGFLQKTKTEEVIMCICGLHVEMGLMVQCGGARCGVWQHARCMRVADTAVPHFCHLCSPNKVDREIPLDEYTDEGHQFYLTLMRGDLQVRQGDTVYVLRDIPIDEKHPDVSQKNGDKTESAKTKRVDRKKVKGIAKGKEKIDESTQNKVTMKSKIVDTLSLVEGLALMCNCRNTRISIRQQFFNMTVVASQEGEVRKHTYQTIGEIPVSELDIFRVERLWKHKDTQERYVYGHHYLRPHETFHEPTRKFFHNEVMRVPLYEAVPIELVMSQCWVMDLNTYCKGRPVGASEPHVYICELRVDRTARLFTKISRPNYPLCTNPYAFTHFPHRLRITRTYAPHEVSPEYLKGRAAKNAAPADKSNKNFNSNKDIKKKLPAITFSEPIKNGAPVSAVVPRSSAHQKERVNNIARRLLRRGGARATLDASYLLAPRRATRAAS